MKIKSMFGPYADRLQVMIDSSLERFSPIWFPRLFPFKTPSASLNFTTIIGRARVEAAASVIARGSAAPLRVRNTIEKISGEVPVIAEKFSMKESDYREFLMLQAISVDDNVKKQQLLDYMFADIVKAGNSAMKRLDYMVLEGLYSGKITLNTTNNPDGTILASEMDLLMPAENNVDSLVPWTTSNTAKPLTDIRNVVKAAKAKGIVFSTILMSETLFLAMSNTTEVKENVANWARLATNKVMPTQETVNEFLRAHRLPTIEIVDEVIGVEKDGVITTYRPFGDVNCTFIPSGQLGGIANALAMEQIRPVEGVVYATFNNALLSKWAENEPFNEWTKVELNAFPQFEAIDSIYILDTSVTTP